MSLFETVVFAEGTAATTAADPAMAAAAGPAAMITSLLPMILIIVMLYFMMIRPQRKKEKALKAMINALKVGDKVVTIGGICGKVSKIKDNFVILETGNVGTPDEKSFIKMERDSIKSVETKQSN
ncbi:MAG: preprotein translocase subunit YajC [Clostridia bacterium]|nr:preprotein translocase subunit YajC [Clostridia bacterium]